MRLREGNNEDTRRGNHLPAASGPAASFLDGILIDDASLADALVPDGWPDELSKLGTREGLKYSEYDPATHGHRQRQWHDLTPEKRTPDLKDNFDDEDLSDQKSEIPFIEEGFAGVEDPDDYSVRA